MRTRSLALGLLAVGAQFVIAPAVARADPQTAEDCAVHSENAQLRRLEGKLVDARDELLACSKAVCPVVVRKDCDRWLAEVDDALPSLVIAARDPSGADVVDVTVSIDGKPVAQRLDGKALPVDPGSHVITLAREGSATIERTLVMREGEKRRRFDVALVALGDAPSTPVGPPLPVAGPASSASPEHGGSASLLGWSLVALSVVGLGAGTYFTVAQANDYGDAHGSCAPSCSTTTKDLIDRERVFAGIGYGVGAVALVSGLIVLLTR